MINKAKLWRTTRDYFFITFGMALYALGFCGFILPEKVVIGGLAGIGTIVYFTTGIPVAITQYALNLILLAIAYKVVGKRFVLGTIYGATMISVFVGIFQPLFSEGFTQEPFLNVVIGGICAGMGVGIAFTHNGSSGGTDIVAAMVSKYTNVSIGRMMLYTDVIVISSSFFLFHQIDKVVYGYVVLILASYVADMVINTNRQAVQFTVFSQKWEEIATAINNEAKRGCTVIHRHGLVFQARSEDAACDVPENRIGNYFTHHKKHRPRCLHHSMQRKRRIRQGLRRPQSEDEARNNNAPVRRPLTRRRRRLTYRLKSEIPSADLHKRLHEG